MITTTTSSVTGVISIVPGVTWKVTFVKFGFVLAKSDALSVIVVVPSSVRAAVATAASWAGFVKSASVYRLLLMLVIT